MTPAELRVRPVDDVVARCHALAAVIGLEEGADPDDVRADVEEHGLDPWLAQNERVFYLHRTGLELADTEDDLEQATIDVTWRTEALWTLLWALRAVDELDPAVEAGGSEGYAQIAPGLDPAETVEGLELRPADELVAMRERYASLDVERDDVDEGIVLERRHALAWLLTGAAWDDIEPDA